MEHEKFVVGSKITLNPFYPVNEDVCRQQIASNMSLGFPEALVRKKLHVIANGPSARGLDLSLKRPTLALNGAMKLFTEQRIAPTYWAACDPQEIVADFLPDIPPYGTEYLVASKCHPSVFKKLKNHNVKIWHVGDYAPAHCAATTPLCAITLTSVWLMLRTYEFTDYEFSGWDGCFIDERHHASDDNEWGGAPPIEVTYGGKVVGEDIVGGRTFATTPSWVAEAQDAQQFFQLAKYFNLDIKINGDGMFECERKFTMREVPDGEL